MSTLLLRLPKLFTGFNACPYVSQSRGLRGRREGHRGAPIVPHSQVLLDKFVKHTRPDGCIKVTAPFHLKIRGSYFDQSNNVDRDRNRVGYKNHQATSSPERRKKPPGQHFVVDSSIQDVSPLHLLIYGRITQRIDSYSILETGRQTSHIYITDSHEDIEELDSVFMKEHYMENGHLRHMKPSGNFSIFQQPNLEEDNDGDVPVRNTWSAQKPNNGGNFLAEGEYEAHKGKTDSAFRIYCPPHILEALEHGIKAVFLVPTVMKNICMHGEKDGDVELDGRLVNGLNLVDLTTEEGDINVRDVFATDIRLVAQGGNVVSEGILEGSVYVDIANDGDFVAKYVEGPSLMASTELGNINVMGDCHSEMSQFRTAVGNINLRHLFGHSYILVKRSGTVVLHLIEGSVNVSMQTGGAFTILENIVSDSSIQIYEAGDIIVTIPARHQFRIEAAAGRLNVPPKLTNLGEIFIDENTHKERFSCGDHRGKTDNSLPVLNLEALNGAVSIVLASDPNQEVDGELMT